MFEKLKFPITLYKSIRYRSKLEWHNMQYLDYLHWKGKYLQNIAHLFSKMTVINWHTKKQQKELWITLASRWVASNIHVSISAYFC